MYIEETDRITIKAILGSATRTLRYVDPALAELVGTVLDVFTTDEDRARVAAMKARLAEARTH